jgi:hypothetical protein
MRRKLTFVAVMTLATVLAVPSEAAANGGAYIQLDREHYRPGEHGTASTYVTVPKRREGIFDRGPFYLYVMPEGTGLREGRPIPAAAIRIGTFSVEEEKEQYELSASFVVPELAGDFYSLGVCNDPCTITGFREPLSAQLSVVATRREAELLATNSRVWNQMYRWRRDARRAERRVERLEEELALEVANGAADREELASEIERLEAELTAARRRATEAAARPPVEPRLVGGIVALALVTAGLSLRRRRRIVVAPIGNGSDPLPRVPIHSARAADLDRR